jgi:hypothetical protein
MVPRVRVRVLLRVLLLLAAAAVGGAWAQPSCYEDATQPSCETFTHPPAAAAAEVDDLCMMMDWMPGCSVGRECAALAAARGVDNLDANSTRYCASFSVLGDICEADMPMMSGCDNYTALCATPGTVVGQCATEVPVPGLPTTEAAAAHILRVCDSHAMDGCELCTIDRTDLSADPKCDLMGVYASLCLKMPDMAECTDWRLLCESLSTWTAWCPSDDPRAGQPPIMRMYFHTGIVDYVLFYGWVPRTDGQYIATMLAVVALAILYDALRTVRHYTECRWAGLAASPSSARVAPASKAATAAGKDYKPLEDPAGDIGANSGGSTLPGWAPQPFRPTVDLLRALLHACEVLLGYSLMLIAMTFNVGLFLAVVVGAFLGSFLFARYRAYAPAPAACC